jgi:PilZ domain
MHERRKTTRNRSYFGGQIAFNGQRSLMDCLVRNISGEGAKLVFTQTATVPQEFDLSVHSKERTFRARVVWRKADEAGVAFLEPRPQSAPISLDLVRRLRQCEADKAALRQRVEQLSGTE